MSCGNPHETDCSEVIEKLYFYLDQEQLTTADISRIRQHLDECGPCLGQYKIEDKVKALVHRSCRSEVAPERLRVSILEQIQQVQRDSVEITTRDVRVEVTVERDRPSADPDTATS